MTKLVAHRWLYTLPLSGTIVSVQACMASVEEVSGWQAYIYIYIWHIGIGLEIPRSHGHSQRSPTGDHLHMHDKTRKSPQAISSGEVAAHFWKDTSLYASSYYCRYQPRGLYFCAGMLKALSINCCYTLYMRNCLPSLYTSGGWDRNTAHRRFWYMEPAIHTPTTRWQKSVWLHL